MTAAPGVLVVADGWLVDSSSADRLARQLAHAPAAVAGVAAAAGPLAPGTSYRVHAERCSLLALGGELHAAPDHPFGAVMLRPEIAWADAPAGVVVDGGPVLLDSGAYAHDPTYSVGPILAADPGDRPPFPWRPVVAFVGRAADNEDGLAAHNEWARQLVAALLPEDIEGRLAMAAPAPGHHLTRPCLPSDASVAALGPDTVVALDADALNAAQCSPLLARGTTVIAFDPAATGIELVSWQIERASGRLRARVGPDVVAQDLAEVIRRLAAGPQPTPPTVPFVTAGEAGEVGSTPVTLGARRGPPPIDRSSDD